MLSRALILIHLLGVVLFFSNAVAAIFWKGRAERSQDGAIVAHTFRTLNAGDRWITPIAVVLILGSGVVLALVARLPLLGTGWVMWSSVAFLGSGASFVAGVLPLQLRLAAWATERSGRGDFDWESYRREARGWSRWAHISLSLAFLALAIMVTKPDLPAL